MRTRVYESDVTATGIQVFRSGRTGDELNKIPTSQLDVAKVQVNFSDSGEIRVYGRVDMDAAAELIETIDDEAVYTILGKYNHIWFDTQSITGTARITVEAVLRSF